ncbi:hypothetical protein ABEX30_25955 [Priestia aryabhattai]|uniref:hypothetical protein n=1 Tax=Priestia aryabhattai TaxID=412384 RepID=UPI003D29F930
MQKYEDTNDYIDIIREHKDCYELMCRFPKEESRSCSNWSILIDNEKSKVKKPDEDFLYSNFIIQKVGFMQDKEFRIVCNSSKYWLLAEKIIKSLRLRGLCGDIPERLTPWEPSNKTWAQWLKD